MMSGETPVNDVNGVLMPEKPKILDQTHIDDSVTPEEDKYSHSIDLKPQLPDSGLLIFPDGSATVGGKTYKHSQGLEITETVLSKINSSLKPVYQFIQDHWKEFASAATVLAVPVVATAQDEDPKVKTKIDSLLNAKDGKFFSEQLRLDMLFNNGFWIKYDANGAVSPTDSGKNDMWGFGMAINPNLSFSVTGDIVKNGENVNEIYFKVNDNFTLPIIGDSNIALYNLNSFKGGEKVLRKFGANISAENVAAGYLFQIARDGETHSRYFGAVRNSDVYLSLGKSQDSTVSVLMTPFSFTKAEYDLETDKTEFTLLAGTKGITPGYYDVGAAHMVTGWWTVGTKDLFQKNLAGFLQSAEQALQVNVTNKPGELFELKAQYGFNPNGNFGLGGGFLYQNPKDGNVIITPVASLYVGTIINGSEVGIEATASKDKVAVFARMILD
jgi:hypothetical protein